MLELSTIAHGECVIIMVMKKKVFLLQFDLITNSVYSFEKLVLVLEN